MKLDREDTMEAVSEGVRRGIVELGTSHGRFDIPHELLYDAIRQGVRDAILRISTKVPSLTDQILEAIGAGVAESFSCDVREIITKAIDGAFPYPSEIASAIFSGTHEAMKKR